VVVSKRSRNRNVCRGPDKQVALKKFSKEYLDDIRQTSYIGGNTQTELVCHQKGKMVSGDSFGHFDEVWRYAWDEDIGTTPARPVTDRAIAHYREHRPEKMIVHYMQPHFPSVPNPELGSKISIDELDTTWRSIWKDLERNEVTEETVWEAYKDNLSYVLNDVKLLIESIDAEKVIITSDHGNAIGELGFYGHGVFDIKSVRTVPWCRTSAENRTDHVPEEYCTGAAHCTNVKERLRQLGYKE